MSTDANDFEIRPIENEASEAEPRVYKVTKHETTSNDGRRRFLKAVFGAAAVSLGTVLAGCGGSTFDVASDGNGTCGCHVQCTCDTDDGGDKQHRSSERTSTYSGSECTCDTVCSCNMVCTCDTVSTGGGGGGAYCSCDYVCTCNKVYI